jgi:hypothetical protein
VESVEDSVEETFSEDARRLSEKNNLDKEGTVSLTFPICSGEIGLDKQWPWNLCVGLIGGAHGTTMFCLYQAHHRNRAGSLQSCVPCHPQG